MQDNGYARREDVERAISGMPVEYITCRDLGHKWDYKGDARQDAKTREFERTLVCERCETERIQRLGPAGERYDINGEEYGGGYDYAEGYLINGIGRVLSDGRDAIRFASLVNQARPAARKSQRKKDTKGVEFSG